MANINYFESVCLAEKDYVDENQAYEEVEELDESWKEIMELMADESKPHFTNIWQKLPSLVQLK